ncbi:MAG: alpha/beta hydrolase [Actinomycetota bacterium]|nr:alpha/beta hydrolase [Actinomycetota bacterium]
MRYRPVLPLTGALVLATDLLARRAVRRWAATPDPRAGAVPPPPDVETVVETTDGALLRVVEWGGRPGRTVVLLHGITATLEDWLPVVAHLLGAGHRVVAVDLRGHGGSTLGRDRVSTGRLASDVADVLEARDLQEVVLAGHSLGGYVALALAVSHPEVVARRVVRVVVLGSTPSMRGPRELTTLATNASPLTKALQMHPLHGAVFLRVNAFGDDPSLPAVEDLRARWSRCAMRTRVAFATGVAGESVASALGQVDVAVTVVRGTKDRVVPASRSAWLCKRIPRAGLVVMPGAGHVVATERPREVAGVLAEPGGRGPRGR